MYVEQRTEKGVLVKLKIQGNEEELRALALKMLDAIDAGKASAKITDGDVPLKIRIVKTD